MVKTTHDFNWSNYTRVYSNQLKNMETRKNRDFLVKETKVENGEVVYRENLHENWRDIYNLVHMLKPNRVFECGCGAMYHLYNIKKLFPRIQVFGCDLLRSQIELGIKKFGIGEDITNHVKVINFSKPDATAGLSKYDLVFSHAVMMHIPYANAKVFLKNMTKISSKYIFLIDSNKHDFSQILKDIGEYKNWKIDKHDGLAKNPWLLTKKGK